MTDLVERLRSHGCKSGCGTMEFCICAVAEEAADEIETLRRRLESQGQIIRTIGAHAREADRAFAAWVQSEWERDHAQSKERLGPEPKMSGELPPS